MQIKKMIALGACVCLSATIFVGCRKDTATDPSSAATNTTAVSEEVAMNIPETLVYDKRDIKVWFSQPDTATNGAAQFVLTVENTSDANIQLNAEAMVINGITLPSFLYCDIPAGERVEQNILFSQEEMTEYGIEAFATVGLSNSFITDGETFKEALAFSVVSEVGKTGEYEQKEMSSGIELINEDGIQVVAQSFYKDYFGDYYLRLYVKNTSGKNVNVAVRETEINSKSVNGWMHEYVADGTWALCDIGFYAADVDNLKLDVFESVSAVFDAKTADYEIVMESDSVAVTLSQIDTALVAETELRDTTAEVNS